MLVRAYPMFHLRLLATGALVVLLGIVAGCRPDLGRGTIKGKVTVNGKPLPKGLITFLPEAGNKDPFSSPIRDGEYSILDVPIGEAKIYITPPLNNERLPSAGDRVPAQRPGAKTPTLVADRYQNAATSGLSWTVQKGENTFDADLAP